MAAVPLHLTVPRLISSSWTIQEVRPSPYRRADGRSSMGEHLVKSNAVDLLAVTIGIKKKVIYVDLRFTPCRRNASRSRGPLLQETIKDAQLV